MSEISLTGLEEAQNKANGKFLEAQEAVQAAADRTAAAKEAYKEAEEKFMYGEISFEELESTKQAVKDAKAAEKAANADFEAAAKEAQDASDAVEAKKQEIRDNRANDTSYVVHCARIECPFGMRESYLALDSIHGVLTHQIPQMTVKDFELNTNIINFGGCHSRENPDVQEAIANANEIIESKKDWRDNVVDFFTKRWEFRKALFRAGKKLLGFGEKEKSEEEKLAEQSSDFVGE